jgi:Flp pilus assembly protein TadG
MMKRYQRGTTVVEFAIVGALLLMLIFAVIEMGRALFIVNTLTEATRRGARLAAVCPVGDPKPAQVAVFAVGGGNSAVVNGLKTSNVVVEYLDTNGNVIANPGANFSSIRYVRVRIVGFTASLIIPFIMPTLSLSGFSTTLPRESLGIPRVGVVQPC